MSSMSNSAAPLMGFSISQPAIGAALQFFPSLGSKELDQLINAYVPGNALISEKRAAVSMEFFQHSMVTGEFFKFFLVPAFAPVAQSPAMDSGYGSSFTASPASQTTSFSSPNVSAPNDWMRIMTKDGDDITNLQSRCCKTKEQRDHAHLMRIIKACDSCRRKKTKCDPSHKRPGAGSSAKVTKKASKSTRPVSAPKPAAVKPELQMTSVSPSSSGSPPSMPLDAVGEGVMEWEQFIQFDEEPIDTIPVDYDFFMDPAGYFSPAGTSAACTSSNTSPSQLPPTPIDDVSGEVHPGTAIVDGESSAPVLPYMSEGGLESASNYVDFDLFSAPSSPFLDEEVSMVKELSAASPRINTAGRVLQQLSPHDGQYFDRRLDRTNSAAVAESVNIAPNLHVQSTSLSPADGLFDYASFGAHQDVSNFRRESTRTEPASNATNHHVTAPASSVSFDDGQSSYDAYGGINDLQAHRYADSSQGGVFALAAPTSSDLMNSNVMVSSTLNVLGEGRRSDSVFATANQHAIAPDLDVAPSYDIAPGQSFDTSTAFTGATYNNAVVATEQERLPLRRPTSSSHGVLSTSAAQGVTSEEISRLYERHSIRSRASARTDSGTPDHHVMSQTRVARSVTAINAAMTTGTTTGTTTTNATATTTNQSSLHAMVAYATPANVAANVANVVAVSAVSHQDRLEGVRFDPRRIVAAQPIVSTQHSQLADDLGMSSASMLLLGLATLLLFTIASYALMVTMSLVVAWSQRNRSMLVSHKTTSHSPSSDESKATGTFWNQLCLDTIDNVKTASMKLDRIVRCGLGQKLRHWMPRNVPSAPSTLSKRKQIQTYRRTSFGGLMV